MTHLGFHFVPDSQIQTLFLTVKDAPLELQGYYFDEASNMSGQSNGVPVMAG